jgi:hypothetical protein
VTPYEYHTNSSLWCLSSVLWKSGDSLPLIHMELDSGAERVYKFGQPDLTEQDRERPRVVLLRVILLLPCFFGRRNALCDQC